MDPEETRRRIKAARILAGLDSADALAERLRAESSPQGFGDRTVRKMESGEQPYVAPGVLREIARVCGLPEEFFTIDFASLDGLDFDDAGRIIGSRPSQLAEILERAKTLVAGQRQVGEDLDAIREAVDDLSARGAGPSAGASRVRRRPGGGPRRDGGGR